MDRIIAKYIRLDSEADLKHCFPVKLEHDEYKCYAEGKMYASVYNIILKNERYPVFLKYTDYGTARSQDDRYFWELVSVKDDIRLDIKQLEYELNQLKNLVNNGPEPTKPRTHLWTAGEKFVLDGRPPYPYGAGERSFRRELIVTKDQKSVAETTVRCAFPGTHGKTSKTKRFDVNVEDMWQI